MQKKKKVFEIYLLISINVHCVSMIYSTFAPSEGA